MKDKVFCINCQSYIAPNYTIENYEGSTLPRCLATIKTDYVTGQQDLTYCSSKNFDGNCLQFKKRGAK